MVNRASKDELLSRMDRPAEGAPGAVMQSLAGLLDEESARQMKEAIEEGCETVDEEEWKTPAWPTERREG